MAKSLGVSESAVNAYLASLKGAPKPLGELTSAQKSFQAQVDRYTGAALARDVALLAREYEAAAKGGKINAYEYQQLGKQLDEMKAKGAILPNILHNIWLDHERLNPSIKLSKDLYKDLAAIIKTMPSYKLGAAPEIKALPISQMTDKDWKWVLNLGAVGPLAKAPAREAGISFVAEFSQTMEQLPGVIVGALQGGGNVMQAALGSMGAGVAGYLQKKIKESMGDGLGSALLGGLAGTAVTLGASLLGKLFGKNEGREDAKAFAERFGGFDALRQKMLSLGAEGDRLWIALTQNTKGPAQVAATIKAIEDAMAAAEKKTADMNAELGTMRSRLAELQATSEPTLRDMEAAATRLGISFNDLGPAFQQQKLTEQATEVYNAIDTLRRGGTDMNTILDKSAGALNELVVQSQKTGAAIPENLKPMLQTLADNGQLIDANGDKLTDLANLKFGAPVKSQWEIIGDEIAKLTKSIADLVKQLSGGIPNAAGLAARAINELPDEWTFNVRPNFGSGGGKGEGADWGGAMATGGSGLVTRPTWFLAGEAGPERYNFTPVGRQSYAVGGGLVVNINHPSVREDRDIDAIADAIQDRWEQRGLRS